jgi:hypothetical protein
VSNKGTTFCLHEGQTYIVGTHWDFCYIGYPAIPLGAIVLAPVSLPTILSPPALDNLTPVPEDLPNYMEIYNA